MLPLIVLPCLALVGGPGSVEDVDPQGIIALREELEEMTLPLLKKYRVPGMAMLLIIDGEVAWFNSVGSAEPKSEVPFTLDTLFNVGSISKCVAAIGYMQLAERGVLELDKPVNDLLEGWKVPRSRYGEEGVTLRKILSHTAGLSVSGFHTFDPGKRQPDLIEFLKGKRHPNGAVKLKTAPGAACSYSSGGYAIAELLLREQTGRGLAEYMRKEVLHPLGMTSSEFIWNDKLKSRAAPPLDRRGKLMELRTYSGAEGSGLFCSAADVARLAIACMPLHRSAEAQEVLSTAALREMQSSAPNSENFGMGFQRWVYGRRRIVGHTGGTFGGISSMMLDPVTGDGLVLLSNGTNSDRFMSQLEAHWGTWMSSRYPPTVGELLPTPEGYWVGRPIVEPGAGEQQQPQLQWLSISISRRDEQLMCEIRSPQVEVAQVEVSAEGHCELEAIVSGHKLLVSAELELGEVAHAMSGTYQYGEGSGALDLVRVVYVRGEQLSTRFDGEWESAAGHTLSIDGEGGVRQVTGLDGAHSQLFAPISLSTLVASASGSNLYPVSVQLQWIKDGHLRLHRSAGEAVDYRREQGS